jgi:hypothetical protein
VRKPHGITSQKPTFFIVTVVETSNLTPCRLSVCVSLSDNFPMPEPVFMKLGLSIMAPEYISTPLFKNPYPPVTPTLQPLKLLRQKP